MEVISTKFLDLLASLEGQISVEQQKELIATLADYLGVDTTTLVG